MATNSLFNFGNTAQKPYDPMALWGSPVAQPLEFSSALQAPPQMPQLYQSPIPTTSMGTLPVAGGSGQPGWSLNDYMPGILKSKDKFGNETDGWGSLALGTASGLMNAFMGMKQYGLAKDTLNHNKDVFNKNYAAQRTTTNAQMEDRQAARVASNPGHFQSVSDYMNKNRIV